jgi:energy-converting hydrogenase Eha subunit A
MIALWGKPAVKWGVLLGLVIGLLGALYTVLATGGHDLELGGVSGWLQIIVVLGVFFGVGWWVARETANVTRGAIAGLVVGMVAAGIVGLTDLVLAGIAPIAYAHFAGFDELSRQPTALLGTVFAALLLNLLQYAIFGAALGALGGLAGSALADWRRRPDQLSSR